MLFVHIIGIWTYWLMDFFFFTVLSFFVLSGIVNRGCRNAMQKWRSGEIATSSSSSSTLKCFITTCVCFFKCNCIWSRVPFALYLYIVLLFSFWGECCWFCLHRIYFMSLCIQVLQLFSQLQRRVRWSDRFRWSFGSWDERSRPGEGIGRNHREGHQTKGRKKRRSGQIDIH